MSLQDQLFEVYDRGWPDDGKSLSPADRELYLIQDFILEYEMGGLSGYLFNQREELDVIAETVDAMSARGLSSLAALLGEVAGIFRGVDEPIWHMSWGEISERYDPTGRLDELHDLISRLHNYGLDEASTS